MEKHPEEPGEERLRFQFLQPSFQKKALAREVGRLLFRRKKRASRVAGRLLGALALVMALAQFRGAALLWPAPEFSDIGWSFPVISLAFGVLFTFLGLRWMGALSGLRGRLTLAALRERQGDTRFYEGGVEDLGSGVCVRYGYAAFTALYEGPAAYYFYVDKAAFLILQKDSLTLGDPERFRAFMEGKTGKTIEKVR